MPKGSADAKGHGVLAIEIKTRIVAAPDEKKTPAATPDKRNR